MHSTRNKGKQQQAAARRKPVAAILVGRRLQPSAHLQACRKASRTIAIQATAIPTAWQGQALKVLTRKPDGHIFERIFTIHSVSWLFEQDSIVSHHKHAIESSNVTDRATDFDSVIYLRGITARTFNLMTGQTEHKTNEDGTGQVYWKGREASKR